MINTNNCFILFYSAPCQSEAVRRREYESNRDGQSIRILCVCDKGNLHFLHEKIWAHRKMFGKCDKVIKKRVKNAFHTSFFFQN